MSDEAREEFDAWIESKTFNERPLRSELVWAERAWGTAWNKATAVTLGKRSGRSSGT